MRVSVGLPTHRVDLGDEFISADGIADMAQAAEAAGFDAISVTDHPFPWDKWLAHGGHHAVDPFVALSFAAAATTTVRLHTNLLVVSYRNPWLAAHSVATLDRLSGGRMILGIGAGYLEAEFQALGVTFDDRNERTDESIRIMRRAWTGESIDGNTMQPTPAQPGGPPIWIGGNSRRAVRRAVELGDAWTPFPTGPAKVAARTRTASLNTPDDLRTMVSYAAEHSAAVGRTKPLDVVFSPLSLTMIGHELTWKADEVLEEIGMLRATGMTGLNVMLPGDSRAELADEMARFGDEVISRIEDF
jgi:probable F420-dependent oxidoreductase